MIAAPARAPAAIAATRAGDGPAVVLLHGVAYGPATLDGVAGAVAGGGATAVVPHRAGYGMSADVPPRTDLGAQIDDVAAVLVGMGVRRAVWAGVSGGATIALAAAIRRPDLVSGLLVHEPALGRLAGDLHARLRGAAAAVRAAADPGDGAVVLARRLAGERSWAMLPAPVRDGVRTAGPAVRAEIDQFPAFSPGAAALRTLRDTRIVSSVGAWSGAERRHAGAVLEALAGAAPARPPSGHLVQLEAPDAFARMALSLALPTRPVEEDG